MVAASDVTSRKPLKTIGRDDGPPISMVCYHARKGFRSSASVLSPLGARFPQQPVSAASDRNIVKYERDQEQKSGRDRLPVR